MQQVNIGMIGGGTVGSGVYHAWQRNGALMASRLGVDVQLPKVAVKAFDEPRPYPIPRTLHDDRLAVRGQRPEGARGDGTGRRHDASPEP